MEKKIIEYNKKDLNKLIGTDKKNIDQVLNKNFYQIAKPVQITIITAAILDHRNTTNRVVPCLVTC